jgi:transposase
VVRKFDRELRITKFDAKRYGRFFALHLEADHSFTYERDYDKIEEAARNCGFFCLLTNTDLDSAQTLAKYRRKDVIEKGFDDVKNHEDMKRLRTHRTETTDGKLFCAFIGLIVLADIGVKLGDFMDKKCWSKIHLIREMEKIRIAATSNGKRLMSPLTKTQRTIIETLGLSETDLRAYVSEA